MPTTKQSFEKTPQLKIFFAPQIWHKTICQLQNYFIKDTSFTFFTHIFRIQKKYCVSEHTHFQDHFCNTSSFKTIPQV